MLGSPESSGYPASINSDGSGGNWQTHSVSALASGDLQTLDVDGDGDLDIVPSNFNNFAGVGWIENLDGVGGSWTDRFLPGLPNDALLLAVDIDIDGDPDLIAGGSAPDAEITWWENDTIHGNAVFPVLEFFGFSPVHDAVGFDDVASTDFNGDGRPDVVASGANTAPTTRHMISWWSRDGARFLPIGAFLLRDGPSALAPGDLDGDGDQDVAVFEIEEKSWFENTRGDGRGWRRHSLGNHLGLSSRDGKIAVADLNEDGNLDIVGQDGDVAWWENDGEVPPSFTSHEVDTAAFGARALPADIDGDGAIDILALVGRLGPPSVTDLAWWANSGTAVPTFTKHTVVADLGDGELSTVDLDNDGDVDILTSTSDGFSWWESDGGSPPSFVAHRLSEPVRGVSTADLDVDGDMDILGSLVGPRENVWWESDGATPPSFLKHTIFAASRFQSVPNSTVVADFTLDGLPDFALADPILGWRENRGGQFSLPTMGISPEVAQAGALVEVLKITAVHSGWPSDNPVELVTLDLLFQGFSFLGNNDLPGLIDELRIYRDDDAGSGAGSFQLGEDFLVETIDELRLVDGVQTVTFDDDDPEVRLEVGTDRCYFVVLRLSDGSDIDLVLISHLTQNTSTGEDADFDTPLRLGHSPSEAGFFYVNDPPVADAGPDQTVTVAPGDTALVSLDGSGSSDPDTGPLAFTWTGPFPEGGGTLMGEMAMVTLPAGTHTVTVTVDDGRGGTDTDIVEITVNQPPIADAGPDQLLQVLGGSTADVALDASGSSDPDGDPLTFTWTGPFSEGGGTVMGMMPAVTLPPGMHTITLSVDDGNGSMDSDTVVITVNQIPVANAGPDQTVNVTLGSATVTLDGSGSSDADGDPLTFNWTGTFGAVGGVSPTVTLPGGVHTITLSVDDGKGGVDTDTVIVAVRALEVSTDSFSFLFGKSSGASQAFSIRSLGGRVGYSIPRIASWLRTIPEGGQSTGETDTIQVIVDPAQSPGTYNTNMIIRGNGLLMARIPVTMIVPEGGVAAYPQLRLPDHPAVDAADFIPPGRPGHAMTGKSIIAIFAEGFVADGEFRADTVPLPTKLGGVRVLFDGTAAPLYLVTPGLIHAQLPMGLQGPTATLLVVRDFQKAGSNPREIEINDYSPGIFTLSQNGEGQGIVTFANSPDLAAPVGTVGNSRPATAGDLLTIYANGLGPVDPPLVNGHNSCEPDGVCLPDGSNVVLRHTTMTPVIRVGGVVVPAAKVVFSGSSPASVGVNEIVFEMPGGVPPGSAVPITIETGGVVSKGGVTIAVE